VADAEYRRARAVGRELAERGHVVCGGVGGVMEAACRGVDDAGGHGIGILPGESRAVDGATGTLSEIAHALDFGRPVAGLDTHDVPGVEPCESPVEAVEYVESVV